MRVLQRFAKCLVENDAPDEVGLSPQGTRERFRTRERSARSRTSPSRGTPNSRACSYAAIFELDACPPAPTRNHSWSPHLTTSPPLHSLGQPTEQKGIWGGGVTKNFTGIGRAPPPKHHGSETPAIGCERSPPFPSSIVPLLFRCFVHCLHDDQRNKHMVGSAAEQLPPSASPLSGAPNSLIADCASSSPSVLA